MKKSFLFSSICITIILVSLTQISFSVAWKNGSYADNEIDYDISTDFGTHDWIAISALNILKQHNITNWGWLEDRKDIYLLGTEYPDNAGASTILDGEIIEGFGDTTWHHVYLDWDSGAIVEDDSALRAKAMADLADVKVYEGKFDQAALYLGAMTHYISDLSMFANVAENNVAPHYLDFDYINRNSPDEIYVHGIVESRVQSRTNEYDDMEEFFIINNIAVCSKKPYDAAIDLAWDTFKDSDGTYNAVWMRLNFFIDWATSRYSETNSTKIQYYNRIEENLNNAIEACVCVMSYANEQFESVPIQASPLKIPGFSIEITLSISSICIIIIVIKKRKIKNL